MIELWQLRQRQSLPLAAKIEMSKKRIREWYEHWEGDVSVSFSGGLDSTVLLHLCRTIYPRIRAVFANTGLEYPENVRFVKTVPDVEIVRPDKSFQEVIEQYGYPLISKRVSRYVYECRHTKSTTLEKLRFDGIKPDGKFSPMSVLSKKWRKLIDAPFEISDRCCYYLKKKPLLKFKNPLLGTRADEGQQREKSYLLHGCNIFDAKKPVSTPLAFWTHNDIVQYLKEFSIPYSKLYDMGYRRSGCMFCMFGVHLEKEPNRFQRMKITHPKLWNFCINKLNLKEPLDFIGIPYKITEVQRLLV